MFCVFFAKRTKLGVILFSLIFKHFPYDEDIYGRSFYLIKNNKFKLFWKYQEDNKRNIKADAKLAAVFGQDYATMYEVMKLMSPHVSKKE